MCASNTFLKPEVEKVFVMYNSLVVSGQQILASGFGAIDKIFFSHKCPPKSHPHFFTTVLPLGTNEVNVLCHFVFQ